MSHQAGKGHGRLRKFDVGDAFVSLEDVLYDRYQFPLNRESLVAYCTKFHTEENIASWTAIRDWRVGFSARSTAENIAQAGLLVAKYIGEDAETQINISDASSQQIKRLFQEAKETGQIPETLFDEGFTQIEDIISKDIFPRFIKQVRITLDQVRSRGAALWMLNPSSIKSCSDFFFFPAVVNEAESRWHQIVAAVQMTAFLLIGWFTPYWQLYFYAVYGYFVRFLFGPRLCPNAWLVLFVMTPINDTYKIFESRLVASSPKRFAQFMGLIFASLYCALYTYAPIVARAIALLHITLSYIAGIFDFCAACFTYHLAVDLYHNLTNRHRVVALYEDDSHAESSPLQHPPSLPSQRSPPKSSQPLVSCNSCKQDPFAEQDQICDIEEGHSKVSQPHFSCKSCKQDPFAAGDLVCEDA